LSSEYTEFFSRYIGIDYSGAETPTASLKGLRVYSADKEGLPLEVQPPPSPRRYWTRRGIAEWLCAELVKDRPAIVGIDHGFSFPLRYFERYHIPPDWDTFLDDFHKHWPTDEDNTYVDFIRRGDVRGGDLRMGDSSWFRLTDRWTATAKSVFLFDVQGSVAKSTHAGIPWLRYIRKNTKGHVHFWPFDGWEILPGKSVIAEVYPSLWMRRFPKDDRDNDQHAAYAAAAWLRRADLDGSLKTFLNPPFTPQEKAVARVEGWILGVM
jgi:hypothetical protein